MDNAADKKSIDRKRNRKAKDVAVRDLIIRTLMGNPDGRRYIWLELASCKVFHSTIEFVPGGYAITAFNEGKRSIGLRLMDDISRLCPRDYLTMTLENSAATIEDEDNAVSDESTEVE